MIYENLIAIKLILYTRNLFFENGSGIGMMLIHLRNCNQMFSKTSKFWATKCRLYFLSTLRHIL